MLYFSKYNCPNNYSGKFCSRNFLICFVSTNKRIIATKQLCREVLIIECFNAIFSITRSIVRLCWPQNPRLSWSFFTYSRHMALSRDQMELQDIQKLYFTFPKMVCFFCSSSARSNVKKNWLALSSFPALAIATKPRLLNLRRWWNSSCYSEILRVKLNIELHWTTDRLQLALSLFFVSEIINSAISRSRSDNWQGAALKFN